MISSWPLPTSSFPHTVISLHLQLFRAAVLTLTYTFHAITISVPRFSRLVSSLSPPHASFLPRQDPLLGQFICLLSVWWIAVKPSLSTSVISVLWPYLNLPFAFAGLTRIYWRSFFSLLRPLSFSIYQTLSFFLFSFWLGLIPFFHWILTYLSNDLSLTHSLIP